jgi:hypothetical protein
MPPDMEKDAFKQAVADYFQGFNVLYTLLARVRGEPAPVGIMATRDGGYRVEPYAVWFPWASPRNKLESLLNFFNKIRVTRLGILFIPEKEIRAFEVLSRYGVIQRRGTLSRFYEDGQFAAIYQTRD